jgi:Ca-activated chloride channel homolog
MALPTPRIELIVERGALPEGGGTVRALLTAYVDFPPFDRDRDPLSVALVIDRSGSMSGEPLHYAKRAAITAVTALVDGDRVAVVTYDSEVRAIVPSTAVTADRSAIVRAIEHVDSGGNTALHAGWVEGCTQVLTAPVASGLGRVVLLSDGQANAGITDPAQIADDVHRLTADGVTTSAIGLGRSFNENLMRAIADAGAGRYAFVETPDQLEEFFAMELAGLSALRGRAPTFTLLGDGIRITAAVGAARIASDDPRTLHLPNLTAGLRGMWLLTLELAPGARLTGFRYAWHDLFTQTADEVVASLALPLLPDLDLAQAPMHPEVAVRIRSEELSAGLAAIEEMVDRMRLVDAGVALADLQRSVAAWPEGPERDAQQADLERMADAIRSRDERLSRKRLHKGRYDHESGFRDDHFRAMTERERRWKESRLARMAHEAAPASTFTLLRSDGTTVRVDVVVGDITDEQVDAIVNPSNRGLFGTGGVDGAVHRRGGPELTAACRAIGGIQYGEAVVTPGFRLPAARVIHTTTPPFKGGGMHELATLETAYAASFDLAQRLRLRSLALPAIGTGDFGYPPEEATQVAVRVALRAILQPSALEGVRFVLRNDALADTYRRTLAHAVPQAASGGAS